MNRRSGEHSGVTAERVTAARPSNPIATFRPYRWRGTPGWDPAKVLGDRRRPLEKECPRCFAKPGKPCLRPDGKRLSYSVKGSQRTWHEERSSA